MLNKDLMAEYFKRSLMSTDNEIVFTERYGKVKCSHPCLFRNLYEKYTSTDRINWSFLAWGKKKQRENTFIYKLLPMTLILKYI